MRREGFTPDEGDLHAFSTDPADGATLSASGVFGTVEWPGDEQPGGRLALFVFAGLIGETFPWGALVVNVTGAFSIGVLAWLSGDGRFAELPEAWPLAVTGFLGSYTTVASFSLQTLALARDGERSRAGGNIILSLALSVAAVGGGVVAARALFAAGAA